MHIAPGLCQLGNMKPKDYSVLRGQILEACIAKQQHLLDDFHDRMKHILLQEGLGNEEAYDNTELSQTTQQADEINALNESLTFAQADMNVLQYLTTLRNVMHSTPEPGAVVITNHGSFLVSVSAGEVLVDNEMFIGLSTNSPLFMNMKGKHSGDQFEAGKTTFTIQEIF